MVNTQAGVDLVLFQPERTVDWGRDYSGHWVDPSVLRVTLNDTFKVNPHTTRVDLFTLNVAAPCVFVSKPRRAG